MSIRQFVVVFLGIVCLGTWCFGDQAYLDMSCNPLWKSERLMWKVNKTSKVKNNVGDANDTSSAPDNTTIRTPKKWKKAMEGMMGIWKEWNDKWNNKNGSSKGNRTSRHSSVIKEKRTMLGSVKFDACKISTAENRTRVAHQFPCVKGCVLESFRVITFSARPGKRNNNTSGYMFGIRNNRKATIGAIKYQLADYFGHRHNKTVYNVTAAMANKVYDMCQPVFEEKNIREKACDEWTDLFDCVEKAWAC